MKVDLNQDWTEFLSALIARRVRFVLRAALIAFGFGEATPTPAVLAKPDKVFMLGRKPTRIDILTGIDGVSFDKVWKGRVEAEFASSPLHVIGREQLLANKRAAGRAKDLLDVAALERLSPAPSTAKAGTTLRAATGRRKRVAAVSTKRPR